jgi:hypothetical protein
MTNFEMQQHTNFDGVPFATVLIDLGDGIFKSLPVDENNPEYMAWLNPEPTSLPQETEPVEESEPTELADEPSPDTE